MSVVRGIHSAERWQYNRPSKVRPSKIGPLVKGVCLVDKGTWRCLIEIQRARLLTYDKINQLLPQRATRFG